MSIENITRQRSEAPNAHELEGMPFERSVVRWVEAQSATYANSQYIDMVLNNVIGAQQFVSRVWDAVRMVGRDPEDLWINTKTWGWWDGSAISTGGPVRPLQRGGWISGVQATRSVYLFLSHPLSNGAGIKFELTPEQRIDLRFLAPALPGCTWGSGSCARYEPIESWTIRASASTKTIAGTIDKGIEEWERRVLQLTEYRERNLKLHLERLEELNRLRAAMYIPPLRINHVLDNKGRWDLSDCINAYGRNSTQRGIWETANGTDGDVSVWDIVWTEANKNIQTPNHPRRQYHANDGEISMVVNSEDDEKNVEIRMFVPRQEAPFILRRMMTRMRYMANADGRALWPWLRVGENDYQVLGDQSTTEETNERTV